MKQASLLFLIDKERILLAMKKRGFGVGLWNGVGGKPNQGETIAQTATRECLEEIKVEPLEIKESATLNFYFQDDKKTWNQQVIVYICNSWQGEPMETEEMAPRWFNLKDIPYRKMWIDDEYWLPRVINGEYVKADFYLDGNESLLKYNLESSPKI
jgi:ADP-ribose pyrophosphatase YjhB (NUDIX family)